MSKRDPNDGNPDSDLTPVTISLKEADDEDKDDADDEGGEQRDASDSQERQPPVPREANGQFPKRDGQPGKQRPSRENYVSKQVKEAEARIRSEYASQAQTIAQLQGRIEAMQQMGSARGEQDDQQQAQAQEQGIIQQMNRLVDLASAEGLTAQQRNSLNVEYQRLQGDLYDRRWEAKLEAWAAKREQEQGQNRQPEPNARVFAAKTMLTQSFPRLMQDDHAKAEVATLYRHLCTKHKVSDDEGLLEEAAQTIATERGLGSRQGSARNRAAMGAVGGGGGSRGNGLDSITVSPRMLQGSGVSPQEIARQLRIQANGGDE